MEVVQLKMQAGNCSAEDASKKKTVRLFCYASEIHREGLGGFRQIPKRQKPKEAAWCMENCELWMNNWSVRILDQLE